MKEKLIDEYEKLSVLWNPKYPFNFHRNKKVDAWEIIVKNIKIDILAAKQKIGSILGFRKEKAKSRKNIGTGKGIYFLRKIVYITMYAAAAPAIFLTTFCYLFRRTAVNDWSTVLCARTIRMDIKKSFYARAFVNANCSWAQKYSRLYAPLDSNIIITILISPKLFMYLILIITCFYLAPPFTILFM